jgi:hypothetical protein
MTALGNVVLLQKRQMELLGGIFFEKESKNGFWKA